MALRSIWPGLILSACALGAEPKPPETRLPAYTAIDRLPNGDTVTFAATGQISLDGEIPDPGTYQNTKGDFVPLRGAKQVPDPEGGPLLNRP